MKYHYYYVSTYENTHDAMFASGDYFKPYCAEEVAILDEHKYQEDWEKVIVRTFGDFVCCDGKFVEFTNQARIVALCIDKKAEKLQ